MYENIFLVYKNEKKISAFQMILPKYIKSGEGVSKDTLLLFVIM